jgi:DNA-binding transcriptional MerR regulator
MTSNNHALVLWRTANSLLTLEDLADAAALPRRRVQRFIGFGLIEPSARTGSDLLFPVSSVERVKRILRLKRDLGVNLAGIAVILDLRERIENLQRELWFLRDRLDMVQ